MLRLDTERLKALMDRQGESGRGLAAKSALHYNTIWALLNGYASPNLRTVGTIADTLGVSAFTLLKEETNKHDS